MQNLLRKISWASAGRAKGLVARQLTIWKGTVLAGVVVAAWVSGASAATMTLVANGVDWGTNYYNPNVIDDPALYDKLPNAATGTSPVWGPGALSGSAEVIGDYLQLTTEGTQRMSYQHTSNYTAATTGFFTLETRMRIVSVGSGASGAASLLLPVGGQYFNILFRLNGVGPGSGGITNLDLTQWTTFRFTITVAPTPVLSIYVNDSPTAAFTTSTMSSGTLAFFQFGDGSNGASGQNGVTQWDYIRWTTSGAYAPIPEPHSLALLALGILAFAGRRCRKGSVSSQQS